MRVKKIFLHADRTRLESHFVEVLSTVHAGVGRRHLRSGSSNFFASMKPGDLFDTFITLFS